VAAGATLPDGANVTQVINVAQIERLQNIFQGALGPGATPIDAEVVTVEDGKDKQA
jgi:hypothetical protein